MLWYVSCFEDVHDLVITDFVSFVVYYHHGANIFVGVIRSKIFLAKFIVFVILHRNGDS